MTDEFGIADTEYGQVRGLKVISEVGIPYWRFLGIPYAEPPTGELRFQQAVKKSPWEGVLDTLEEPQPCAGRNSYIKKFIGSDDCLYLNIYTKNLNPNTLSPVLVYIYGGGFYSGSSMLHAYSPDYLLMHDIVVVIFNYRIGPLGFLSLKDKSLNVPGNAGMKDQRMVLEFVRDNIKNFGGDPKNVTLAGHSSGAYCVGLHCLSNSSSGLFHKAIILGGSPAFLLTPHLNMAKRLAVKLGFDENNDDEKDILKFLEKVDAVEMAEAAYTGMVSPEEIAKYGTFFPFGPTIETYNSDSIFLSESTNEMMRNSCPKNIDVLIGGTIDEGMGYSEGPLEEMFPYELKEVLSHDEQKEVIERCKVSYLKRYPNLEKIVEKIGGDLFTWLKIAKFIKSRIKSGNGKTYVHNFAIDSPTQNYYRNRWNGIGSKGVVHADELSYVWKNGLGGVPQENTMEFRAIKNFTSILVNFSKNGNPGIPSWLPVGESPAKGLLILPDELIFDTLEELERVYDFWEKVYEEAGVKFC